MAEQKNIRDEILDSIGEGLLTVDKDFKINFFNRAAEQITGFNREEVLNQFCKYVFRCELCESKCPIGLILESGSPLYDFKSSIEIKDGTRKPVKLNAAILKNESNEPIGGVISFRDLSEIESIRKDAGSAGNFFGIIGRGKAMQDIFSLVKEIADSDATVLIQGESGTGKELVANAIQATSKRKSKPFVKVNCAVFPETLLASELFGHIKGAFTDAFKDRIGRFELANEGTIFLDEVAEMPFQTQVQLLRVLQEGTFERVGESIPRKADVRVIAATNLKIDEALKRSKLREDLYYRLNVIPIFIPPLRDRREDIPYLVKSFIKEYSKAYNKEIDDIEDSALDVLMNYTWPGNVRELENVIEYVVVRAKNMTIRLENLPSGIGSSLSTEKQISEFKKENPSELLQLLEKHKWNKTKAAEELGIGRTTLWRMLKNLKND
ncbi:MAG: sigma 54-interacting transcriptional regulator [Ignavibacteriaceae bacterium]|jgi:PAS domain S-box-containing protein|nr:sigma 54-interacting transcriptional regulator [Ignavibacteriaceae bacterium]MCU0406731.1 sigma 54-interacting transcriptional regulator [Ignavibacteriaceae bacterium]